MNILDVINGTILAVGITVTILTGILIFKYPWKWYLFLPLLFWALCLTGFYILIICSNLMGTTLDIMFNSPGFTSTLSTLQRLDGVITMLFMTILLATEIRYSYFKYERWGKKKKIE